ncbi:MAG: hypothetical protein JXA69_14060, partial [Phycisphaerae bacterium]|nr:hypothetical protein [Phycisphaerae bacterium]
IAGAFVLVNFDNSEAADGTPKMMTFVIEGNFRVHYDCTFMDKTKKTDKEEQVQKIEFHPEYIVLFGQTHNGRVIPVHAIKELTWEQS